MALTLAGRGQEKAAVPLSVISKKVDIMSSKYYLGGVRITLTQYRRIMRRALDGNVRRAKRTAVHWVPARFAREILPTTFGSADWRVSLTRFG